MSAGRVLVAAIAALVLLAGCAGLSPTGVGPDGDARSATVVRVVDGDTIEVAFRNGSRETVRLLGVDTPEVRAANAPSEFEGVPDTEAGAACLERWGERASDFAARRLADETVTVRTDPEADRRDRYGRLLAYVETGNGTFNRALLDTGHARLYDSTFGRRAAYADAEARAQESGEGLWGECRNPERTNASGPLVVAAFQPDAPGNDNENLRAEYVTLRNTNGALNVTGWTLSDEAGHTYTFPRTTLAPNGTVRVVTGDGEDEPGVRYWGREGAVWNNGGDNGATGANAPGGDTLTVRRTDGSVVLVERY